MPTDTLTSSYPRVNELMDGDLLFPKKPGSTVVAFTHEMWRAPLLAHLKAVGLDDGHLNRPIKQLLLDDDTRNTQAAQYVGLWKSRFLTTLERTSRHQYKASDLVDTLTVAEFLDFCHTLFGELGGGFEHWFQGLNFTVSHVAMAFQQEGEWYVMEAGCTDFAHYRVTISPYWDAQDVARANGQARGWAQQRAALGQGVWSGRHQGMQAAHVARIVDHCKTFLSVPYGLLEPGMMNNPDRIYCAELLQRGFAEVDLTMNKHQTWQWVLTQLSDLTDLPNALVRLLLAQLAYRAFPLLSPKMIYTDPQIQSKFKPKDAKGRELLYV